MKSQVMKFKAGIYVITGKSFLCPDNTTKTGDLVIGLDPLEKVDPKNMFAFVVDESGETQSVSRKYLHLMHKWELSYKREMFMTNTEEVKAKIRAMADHLKEFILENRESEQPQQTTNTSNP